MGHIIRWRSRHDTSEVPRVSLRLHQGCAAAIRTAHEIGATRATRFECHDNIFGNVGGLLERSISEIDHLLRMAYSPGRVDATGLMAIVGRRCGIPPPKWPGHPPLGAAPPEPPP